MSIVARHASRPGYAGTGGAGIRAALIAIDGAGDQPAGTIATRPGGDAGAAAPVAGPFSRRLERDQSASEGPALIPSITRHTRTIREKQPSMPKKAKPLRLVRILPLPSNAVRADRTPFSLKSYLEGRQRGSIDQAGIPSTDWFDQLFAIHGTTNPCRCDARQRRMRQTNWLRGDFAVIQSLQLAGSGAGID